MTLELSYTPILVILTLYLGHLDMVTYMEASPEVKLCAWTLAVVLVV